ncbi:MAG: hypothetical protein KIT27_06590 [Legionellales bacterium]|nr:hypothetical protein [Legionellales bacterium]
MAILKNVLKQLITIKVHLNPKDNKLRNTLETMKKISKHLNSAQNFLLNDDDYDAIRQDIKQLNLTFKNLSIEEFTTSALDKVDDFQDMIEEAITEIINTHHAEINEVIDELSNASKAVENFECDFSSALEYLGQARQLLANMSDSDHEEIIDKLNESYDGVKEFVVDVSDTRSEIDSEYDTSEPENSDTDNDYSDNYSYSDADNSENEQDDTEIYEKADQFTDEISEMISELENTQLDEDEIAEIDNLPKITSVTEPFSTFSAALDENGDDSSDEEFAEDMREMHYGLNVDEILKTAGYDLPKKLSFIAHYLGREIYYSKEVDEPYRLLKKSQLKNNFSSKIKDHFTSIVLKVINKLDESKAVENVAPVTLVILNLFNYYLQKLRRLNFRKNNETFLQNTLKNLNIIHCHDLEKAIKRIFPDKNNREIRIIIAAIQQEIQSTPFSFDRQKIDYINTKMLSNSAYEFLANKRLAQRSFVRNVGNGVENLKSFKISNQVSTINWQFFPNCTTQERHEISYNQSTQLFGQTDMVINLGKYKEICVLIEMLKKSYSGDDVIIARHIRDIFNGKKPQAWDQLENNLLSENIKTCLSNLTYLLLGCEPTRNPGLHIINQMMLDLIIAGQLTWQAVLTGDQFLMPMAPPGITRIARILEAEYNQLLPRKYVYMGIQGYKKNDDSDINQLVSREAAMISCWLQHNNYQSKMPKQIIHDIRKHYDQWFKPTISATIQSSPGIKK